MVVMIHFTKEQIEDMTRIVKFTPIQVQSFLFVMDNFDSWLVKEVIRPKLIRGQEIPDRRIILHLHDSIAPSTMQIVHELYSFETLPEARLLYLDCVNTVIGSVLWKNLKIEEIDYGLTVYQLKTQLREVKVTLSFEEEILEF